MSTSGELSREVIGRQQAVAVDEHKVRRSRRANARVAAAADLEAVVRVGDKPQWIADLASGAGDHVGSGVARTVVDDDHFKLARHAPLRREREQTPPQMAGALEGGDDDRQFKRRRHLALPDGVLG